MSGVKAAGEAAEVAAQVAEEAFGPSADGLVVRMRCGQRAGQRKEAKARWSSALNFSAMAGAQNRQRR